MARFDSNCKSGSGCAQTTTRGQKDLHSSADKNHDVMLSELSPDLRSLGALPCSSSLLPCDFRQAAQPYGYSPRLSNTDKISCPFMAQCCSEDQMIIITKVL